MNPHRTNAPRISIDDPSGVIPNLNLHTPVQLTETPIFQRVIGRILHPFVGAPEEKKILWEASDGKTGMDVTRRRTSTVYDPLARRPTDRRRTKSIPSFNTESLPSNEREWRAAVIISQEEHERRIENSRIFSLEKGVYRIDPETGLSNWRRDGSLDHVNKKTRKLILKDEAQHRHLIEERRHHNPGHVRAATKDEIKEYRISHAREELFSIQKQRQSKTHSRLQKLERKQNRDLLHRGTIGRKGVQYKLRERRIKRLIDSSSR